MKPKEYFEKAEEISKELNEYLDAFCEKNPEFLPIKEDYTKKRIHLNGVQFYAGFNAITTNKSWKDYINVPIAIELVMLWAYKTNKIIDHKQETWSSPEKIEKTTLEHDLILSLIIKLLKESRETLKDNFNKIFDIIFVDLIANGVIGFWIERDKLNIRFSSLTEIKNEWAKKYEERNIRFNLVYDYSAIVGYWLASEDNLVFEKYEEYFKGNPKMSHLGQLINDLGDWSYIYDKNFRSYQDQFSDIRNGIITYPVYALLDEKEVMQALENPEITWEIDWRKKAFNLIIKNKIIEKVREMANKCYDVSVNFWRETLGIENNFLFGTYSMLKDNRYFNAFEQPPNL